MSPWLPSGRVLASVAAGGVLGGAARLAVTALATLPGDGLPVWSALVVVNVLGCFAMGVVAARGRWAVPAVTTGVLGGFTSFSGWVLDVLVLLGSAPVLAVVLLLAVPVACVAACVVGLVAGGEQA